MSLESCQGPPSSRVEQTMGSRIRDYESFFMAGHHQPCLPMSRMESEADFKGSLQLEV